MGHAARREGGRAVRRATGPGGLTVGQCVYISGPPSGDLWSVALADCFDEDRFLSVGVVIRDEGGGEYLIQTAGLAPYYSGLTPGKLVFLSASGAITQTPPEAPASPGFAWVHQMGVAWSDDTVDLKPTETPHRRIYG